MERHNNLLLGVIILTNFHGKCCASLASHAPSQEEGSGNSVHELSRNLIVCSLGHAHSIVGVED